MRRLFVVLVLFVAAWGTSAQGALTPYTWQDLTLQVPAGWQAHEAGDTLTLAQAFAADPARLPAIPVLMLRLHTPSPDAPLTETDALAQAFAALNAAAPYAFALDEGSTPRAFASSTSPDGALYLLGQAQRLPDGRLLTLVGRGANANRAAVARAFYSAVASLDNLPIAYRPLWRQDALFSPLGVPFFDFAAVRLAPDGSIYVLERQQGILVFDTAGTLTRVYAFPLAEPVQALALGITPSGAPVVLDVLCGCLRAWQADRWAEGERVTMTPPPAALAISPDGTRFLSQLQLDAAPLPYVDDGRASIFFETPLLNAPLLHVDTFGALYALGTAPFTLFKLDGGAFSELVTLDLPPQADVRDFAVMPDGQLAAVVNDRVLLFGADGRITLDVELGAGSFTSVAVGADGVLFVAGAGERGGVVQALDLGVGVDRIGRVDLVPSRSAGGVLTRAQPTQHWTFSGTAGETVTLAASADETAFALDLALRVFAPDGRELVFVDNSESSLLPRPTDVLLSLVLPSSGEYVMRVERVSGEGSYQLGWSRPQPLAADAPAAGTFAPALPQHHYRFSGTARQNVTLVLNSPSPLLEPTLTLLNARGETLAESTQVLFDESGRSAQLTFTLPNSGQYVVVAGRRGGSGTYTLTLR